MDYARAKSRERARDSRPEPDEMPRKARPLGWRTEWPEEFPVTTTRKDSVADTIRPIDGNGFTPDLDPDPHLDECDQCAECLRADPVYQLGYERGVMDTIGRVLKVAHDNLAETLAKLERPAA